MNYTKFEKTQIGSVIPRATNSAPLFVDKNKKLDQPTNEFYITEEGDFPNAPVGGVITLDTGTYRFKTIITTANRFAFADNAAVVFAADDPFQHGVIYTGSGTMFSGDNVLGFGAENMFFRCASGTFIDVTPSVATTATLFFDDCVWSDVSSLGSVSDIGTFAIIGSAVLGVGVGISLSDINLIAMHLSQWLSWKNQTTTMMTIDGANSLLQLGNLFFTPESNESVLDIKQTATFDSGVVNACQFDGSQGGTFLASGSKDHATVDLSFTANTNITNSSATAEVNLNGNTTVTTVADKNIPAKVQGTWSDSAERFTTDSTGRATYIGLEDRSLPISANPDAVLDTGTNKDVTFYFAKGNDTDNVITAFADAGGGKVTVTATAHGLTSNGSITAFADAGGGKVTVTSASHGLTNSQFVGIAGTTNYNGIFKIDNITTNTFEIIATFLGDDATGSWSGDRVVITGTTNYNGTFVTSNVTANNFEITDTWVSDDATGNWSLILERTRSSNQLASSTKASSTSVLGRTTFHTNDFIEFFAENNSDPTGIVVRNATIIIN